MYFQKSTKEIFFQLSLSMTTNLGRYRAWCQTTSNFVEIRSVMFHPSSLSLCEVSYPLLNRAIL